MITEQYSRISHHTVTSSGYTGTTIFTIPSTEDFTSDTWLITDLALSEIGVAEGVGRAFIRIGNEVKEFNFTSGGTGGGANQNLNQVLTVGNTTGGQDIEMSTGDVIFSGPLGNVDINTHKISNTTTQLIGASLFSIGFANGNALATNLDLNKVNSFTFYVNGINTGSTLGYYGQLRVVLRCDGLGNITQIGVDDLYEVSDFTTVTINSNFIAANQMNFEVNGEAGEVINFDISWRRI